MTHQADSFALSPFAFGEMFFAGAVAMQQQIVEGMMAVLDAVAEAMSDSLRASAELANGIGNARTPADIVTVGSAWFQGRAQKGMSWFRVFAERAPAVATPPALPAPAPAPVVRRAPVEPQIATKPPAGKLRRGAPIVIDKLPKKPARSAAK
jgi:hypothetical protein